MKALVTGAAGFIGSHLSEALVRGGHEVTGIDAFLDYYPREIKERNLDLLRGSERFSLIETPLQELDLKPILERMDAVFHLAAQAGVRASWGEEFSIYTENNIRATQRLLEAAVGVSLRSFVYASSSSVYGDGVPLPMPEEIPLHPVSPYGVSKLAAEMLCHLYFVNYSLPVVSVRYFTVYGPRQRPDMAFHRMLRSILQEKPFSLFGDGRQTRDFTFITDAVSATLAAAEKGRPGRVYNIGGGSRVSMLEVIEVIESLTGSKLHLVREPAQKGDMRDTYADTTAAQEELAHRPSVGLREGLAEEWDWLRSR